MPFTKTHLQVACSLVWCIVAAGPVFGFAALKPVLVDQGVYREKCDNFQVILNTTPCSSQDLALNYLFAMAAVVTNGASLVVGTILDKYGPKFTAIIGAGFLTLASIIMANGYWLQDHFNAYLVGYCTLALGGPFVFISCFHLANAFPNNSGLVLALLTGAFDSSSALFLLYRVVYFGVGASWNLSLQKFFSFYLVVPLFILLAQIFILPNHSYQATVIKKTVSEDSRSEAGIDAPVSEVASIDEYLPIPVPGSKDAGLLNSINENLSLSLNNSLTNILTDQYAHSRSNSFNQRVRSRNSFIKETQTFVNENHQLISDSAIEESDPQISTTVDDIHNTINKAITTEITKPANGARSSNSIVESVISDTISIIEQARADEEIANEAGIGGALHGETLRNQVFSLWFLLMALFTSIQMLRINYFVATIRAQEEFLLKDPVEAKIINEFFDIALPVGGLLSIPFIGILLDNFKTLTVLSILLGVSLVIGIMGMLPYAMANYIGIMLMVLYRPFYYTAVSDYCAKVFGFTTFGTIYGAIICISGLFNFVQTFLDRLTHVTFAMNPVPVNSILTGLTALLGGALIWFVHSHEKKSTSLLRGGEVSYGSI